MRTCFERLKLVAEPSGATALAAVLHGHVACSGLRVGVVLSGGNADPVVFGRALGHQSEGTTIQDPESVG
jgi:threonine dehydratase